MTNSRSLRFAVSTALALGVVACDSGDKKGEDDKADKKPDAEKTVNEGPRLEPEVEEPEVEEPKGDDTEPVGVGEKDPDHINVNEGPKPEPIPLPPNPGPTDEPEPAKPE